MEKIGNVCLDMSCYPGEDLYSDGKVEDRILELAKRYQEEACNEVIAREQDWAVMYHLAHERGNIISWYPFKKEAKVLEIGSGCGAVTGAVAAKVQSVTCIDLSKKRSMINGTRNRKRDNIKICVGNFQDIEKNLEKDFDYATLIGVFEYGKGYIGGDKPYHGFLTTIMEHLKPGGRLLIAIENKLGLKYWAGCTEDHTGTFFEGLEGYQNTEGVRTFSKPELERLLRECGCLNYKFYYPYPDYKFPFVVYSDEYLPRKGELNRNICNFDRKRLVLMDEEKVFDQMLEDGLFPLYANSFFVEVVKEGGKENKSPEHVVYTKYSDGRAPEFAIQTRVVREDSGKSGLYKMAEYPQGEQHIQKTAQAKERLEKLWEKKGFFQVNQCRMEGDRIYFDYLEGTTLEEELDRLLEQGEKERAEEKIKEMTEFIRKGADTEPFRMTPEFREVFGEAKGLEGESAVSTADVDLIFSNILLTGDGRRHVLDYEWTFFFLVPVEYMVYRALHYYIETSPKRKILNQDLKFYERYGISHEKRNIYEEMERNFQKYIRGSYVPVGELYRSMGKPAIPLAEILQETNKRCIQVYPDYGQGFSEETSWFLEQNLDSEVNCHISLPNGVKGLRIDPALSPCILKDLKLNWIEDGADSVSAEYRTSGAEIGKNCYLFDNSDPKIIIKEIPEGKCRITISYRISILEEETAVFLADKAKLKERVKRKVRGWIKG